MGHELDALGDGSRLIRSILAARSRVTGGERGIILFCDFGERKSLPNSDQLFAVHSFRSFLLRPGLSIEDSLKRVDHVEVAPEAREPEEAFNLAIRLICTLGLLGGDPDIVQPDVLERDRRRYDDTRDSAIVDRAVRRGKRGWLVGAQLDVSPHYRRPHFALRWTGEGRHVPRIVPVKGAVVHRHKLTELPSGQLDAGPTGSKADAL